MNTGCLILVDRFRPAAPVPFPPQWQRLMEAFDFYLAHSADRDVRPKVLFRKARALHAYGHLTQAAALSRQVIDTYPEHDVLSDSLHIYFAALEAMGQRPLACQEAKHWLSDPMASDHHARIELGVQEAAPQSR